MGKYEKRRLHKQYRKANGPFLLSLALIKAKNKGAWALTVPPGFTSTVLGRHCDCCGPTQVKVQHKDRSWTFNYWSLDLA